jgi:hypothetical protein
MVAMSLKRKYRVGKTYKGVSKQNKGGMNPQNTPRLLTLKRRWYGKNPPKNVGTGK